MVDYIQYTIFGLMALIAMGSIIMALLSSVKHTGVMYTILGLLLFATIPYFIGKVMLNG